MLPTSTKAVEKYQEGLSPFGEVVEAALNHVHDPAWLSKNSPLAAPYLLHDFVPPGSVDGEACGRALGSLLCTTGKQIDDPIYGERYRRIICEYYCNEEGSEEGISAAAMQDRLGLRKVAFHASRRRAIAALEHALLDALHPALRLDRPLQLRRILFGRQEQLERAWTALASGGTVVISGSGGAGKTALASLLAHRWQGTTFWFTMRPGLNDRVSSLLFALGRFLHACGESTLWRELVGRTAPVDSAIALETIRYALDALRGGPGAPLLCFDEVDLLQPAVDGNHSQLHQLLRGLRGLAPVLLIGQRPELDGDYDCRLRGLNLAETGKMCAEAGLRLAHGDLKRLHDYTQGNPRLLELFLIMLEENAQLSEILEQEPDVASLASLLGRVLQRLSEQERSVAIDLAVYRTAAPRDIWRQGQAFGALLALAERGLVQSDGFGGVFLVPAYRDVIYRDLPPEKRQQLHGKAAVERLVRGAYTAAAYHFLWAGQPARAVEVWRENKQTEIGQGQAAAALQVLHSLLDMPVALPAVFREEVRTQCGELARLLGDPARALDDLRSIMWKTPILEVEGQVLAGMAANDLSDFEYAQRSYRRALALAEKVVEARMAAAHKGLGWAHMRVRELDAALREGQIARYESDNFLGYVWEMRCDYRRAEHHYLSALQLAEVMQHSGGIAKTCLNLSGLYARQGQFTEAKQFLAQAEATLTAMGLAADAHSTKINWAFIHNLACEHEQAVAALEEVVGYFDRSKRELPPWQHALIEQALAEAYLGLGELDLAEQAVAKAVAAEELDILADSYRTLGEIQRERGSLADAENSIRLALQTIQEAYPSGDLYLEAYARRALGDVLAAQGRAEEAEEESNNAVSLFHALNLSFEASRTEKRAGCWSVPD